MINCIKQEGEGNDPNNPTNLTAYVGVYDNWNTEHKASKCSKQKKNQNKYFIF